MFEATDLKHAIQLMSKNPAVKSRIVEIRLAENLAELIRESERRRATFLAVYETREQIAGYFLIHAKDRDETIGLTAER